MTAAIPESKISAFLNGRLAAGDFPSAVYLIAENGEPIFADALGDAVVEPERCVATLDSIYDLASLTKPLITGLLCARFVEANNVSIEAPVAEYLTEFNRLDKHSITIRQLLTHTSGLPAWRPLYLLAQTKEEALTAIANEQLERKPGEQVIYSDLGFITLGFLLEHLTKTSLLDLAQREVFAPLHLQRTCFNPSRKMRASIAASEAGNAYERNTCEELHGLQSVKLARKTPWREAVIWGEVHDGNAHFLGGAAGHAGLFSTATDTLGLANQFIAEQSELLSPQTCQLFHQNWTEGLNEARSFAWQLAATKDSTAGHDLPPDAFGHTGFTGTSCWIDAARERVFILLTNRTHHRALPFANINAVRRNFHSLAVAALASR